MIQDHTMGKQRIKEDIYRLVGQIDDERLLGAYLEILRKSMPAAKLDKAMAEEMEARAKASEEDIKAGRVYGIEEFEKKLGDRLGL